MHESAPNTPDRRQDKLKEVMVPVKDDLTGEVIELPSVPGLSMTQYAHMLHEKGYSLLDDQEFSLWQASKSDETTEDEFTVPDDERRVA